MKVLITGSSGYLGRLLTDYLIRKKVTVIGLDIRENPEITEGDYFRFYNCSITDYENLKLIFTREQPTNVVHFACSFNKIRDRKKEYLNDVEGSANVLKASDETPGVRQLVYSSSTAAYGGYSDNKPWIKEEEPLRPGKYRYGINKELIEGIFTGGGVRNDLLITILRICTVVEPSYEKPKSVVSILIKSHYLPACFKENCLQFLHGDDMLELFRLILEDKNIGGIFNFAPDSYSVVKELVEGRIFINIPLFFIKGVTTLLWKLKILNLEPAALNTAIYPIILSPLKITGRYGYRFKYTSTEAFMETYRNNSFCVT